MVWPTLASVPPILAVLPLKAFDRAKERLGLPAELRREFVVATAGVVADACVRAGLDLAVVTDDPEVGSWAVRRGARVVADPGIGLDGAAEAGAALAAGSGRPWLVVHGDLPLLEPADVAEAAAAIAAGAAVLAPSRDGGTNLLSAPAPISFAYGPGSFARHVAAVGPAPRLFLVRPGTAVEVDTARDLAAAAALAGTSWLDPYLRAAEAAP